MRPVPLDHGGVALTGELYGGDGGGSRPGILVMHNGLGLGGHVRTVAATLAELGYAALASDMYGVDPERDPAQAIACYATLTGDPDLLRARAVAWHDRLAGLACVDRTRTAAIGYCFGGMCVLELARSGAKVKAVASFHGLLKTHRPALPGAIADQVAIWTGAHDPFVPQADVAAVREEMAAAGASAQITVFGTAAHAFTDPDAARLGRPGIAYDAVAAGVSWAGTLALFDLVL